MRRTLALVVGIALPATVFTQPVAAQDSGEEAPPEGGVIFVEHEDVPPPDDQAVLPPQQQQQYPQQQQTPPGYAQPQPQPQAVQPVVQVQPQVQPQARQRRYRETYDPNQQYPENAQVTSRVRLGLMIPGAALFLVPYIITVSSWSTLRDSRSSSDQPQNVLLVPAVGPFIAIADLDRFSNPGLVRTGLIWDGLLQTAGLAMLIAGAIPKKIVTYYADTSQPGYVLMPRVGQGGAGLDLNVRF